MAEQTQPKKHILVALVENKPGVLNRVASLFRRRNFNVDSLTVGRTHKEHISRMTIVVDDTRIDSNRITSNLFKLINVIEVAEVSQEPHVARDLALIKVRSNDADSRNSLTLLCERYPARIVDIGPEYAIVEMAAQPDMIEVADRRAEADWHRRAGADGRRGDGARYPHPRLDLRTGRPGNGEWQLSTLQRLTSSL